MYMLVLKTMQITKNNWTFTPEKNFNVYTGNFTQMIWRSTDQVGVGLASDGKGKFITVAFYKPPGNITNPGYFQDNVKPAGRWSAEEERGFIH